MVFYQFENGMMIGSFFNNFFYQAFSQIEYLGVERTLLEYRFSGFEIYNAGVSYNFV